MQHIEDETFTKTPATQLSGRNRTYENCKFISCDLSHANLNGVIFIDCVFDGCNLALADASDTGFQNIQFKHCKLVGLNFGKARDFLFEVNFEGCILDNAIFYKKKNKKALFKDCSMTETDLTETDLTEAKFINCNLNRAFFSRTILKAADLRSSYNYTIDPDDNMIKKAMFSIHGLPGLLAKYDIKIEG
jgi:fluoroquinolone resistance protein